MMRNWLRPLLPKRYRAEQEIQRFDRKAKERDRILETLQRQYEERYGHLS